MDPLFRILEEWGFPVAVAFFLLWRLDGSLRRIEVQLAKMCGDLNSLLTRDR